MSITAFSIWKNRIAPVFDVSRSLQIVEIHDGEILRQSQAIVPEDLLQLKALRLMVLKVDLLVCGAISRTMKKMIVAHGIDVIPFVAGDLQKVVHAWVCGDLTNAGDYAMPGCRRGGENLWNDFHAGKEEELNMFGNKRSRRGAGQGKGSGGQRGQKQRAGRQATGTGATTSATQGFCVCPQCGYREPHASGVPCVQHQCPQCGAVMGRQ